MFQLSIFLENSKGRLAEVLKMLTELGVNIRALSLADTKDYGVLRIIVDNPREVAAKLKDRDCVVTLAPVWVIRVPDKAGGLADILDKLVDCGVIVEYMYAFVEKANEHAQVVLRVHDDKLMLDSIEKLNWPNESIISPVN